MRRAIGGEERERVRVREIVLDEKDNLERGGGGGERERKVDNCVTYSV